MFLRGALGAAILAVPLAGAFGQSASRHDPAAKATGDSSGGHHRLAWVAGAGATGATVFATFVRLSERGVQPSAERGLTLPNSPVPSHYTGGTLPVSGASPGQNSLLPDLPGDSIPPGGSTSSDPLDSTNGTLTNPPLQYQPPQALAVVVTTPEPESIFLLGTGVISLLPALRRRRRES